MESTSSKASSRGRTQGVFIQIWQKIAILGRRCFNLGHWEGEGGLERGGDGKRGRWSWRGGRDEGGGTVFQKAEPTLQRIVSMYLYSGHVKWVNRDRVT